ncbi:MAG: toll/interleukin-1 receptor domain-containing protein [Spirochaetaceae bacterium]|nr:toll/interleukin-1 receptor domain-containing protein [Spirochaetaceae bacterium]
MQTTNCPFCNSPDTYFSKKKQKWVCEDCEKEFEIQEQSKSIFFSYPHDQNALFVDMIRKDLEKEGITVWFDKSEIKAGDDWRNNITSGLLHSDSVLAFLSKYSTRTPGVCLDEIKIALCVKNGNIHTVLTENENEVDPPSSISNIQWLDASKWATYYNTPYFDEWYTGIVESIKNIVSSNNTDNFNGEIDFIKTFLKPMYSDIKEYALLSKNITKRPWIDKEIEQFRNDGKYNVLAMYGDPGSGKSCYAASLIHYNPDIICSLFCEWDKPVFMEQKNIVKTIAFKISSKMSDYRKYLFDKLHYISEEKLNKMDEDSLFNYLVIEPLTKLIDGNRDVKFIVIDGLDELSDTTFLHSLLQNISLLPKWIKIILTSRKDFDVVELVSYFNVSSFDISASQNNISDLKSFIKENSKTSISDEVENEILQLCSGSFLIASLIIQQYSNLNDLPTMNSDKLIHGSKISQFYYMSLARMFADFDEYCIYKDIIGTILCGNDIPLYLLSERFGFETVIRFRKIFNPFLMVSMHNVADTSKNIEILSFFHKSFIDFITSKDASVYQLDYEKENLLLAEYLCNLVSAKSIVDIEEENYKLYYYQHNIMQFYMNSKDVSATESFLLEVQNPLRVYFDNIDRYFSNTYKYEKIIKRIWDANDKNAFLTEQQEKGNTRLLLFIFDKSANIIGLEKFTHREIEIYMDIVHLGGQYEEAVKISEKYLASFNEDEIYADNDLLMMRIRRLHHMMFYAPVKNLIAEALEIEKKINKSEFRKEYNELLFLIGGNLGCLYGDLSICKKYLDSSWNLANETNDTNFKIRTVRKLCDMLAIQGKTQEAFDLIIKYINPDNLNAINNRYQIYLLGCFGELYRNLNQNQAAYACFDLLYELSEKMGIPGWIAHAMLGKAFSLYGIDNTKALEYAEKALALYEKIQQRFGEINANYIIKNIKSELIDELLVLTKQYNYEYMFSSFKDGKDLNEYHLSFL